MLPRNKATNRLTGLLFSRLESHAISDRSTTRASHNYQGLWRWSWHQLLGLIAGDHWHWLLVTAAELRHSELQTDACRWTATDDDSFHSPYLLTAQPRRHARPHCHYESYISHAGMHDHTVITGRTFHTQTCTTTLSRRQYNTIQYNIKTCSAPYVTRMLIVDMHDHIIITGHTFYISHADMHDHTVITGHTHADRWCGE